MRRRVGDSAFPPPREMAWCEPGWTLTRAEGVGGVEVDGKFVGDLKCGEDAKLAASWPQTWAQATRPAKPRRIPSLLPGTGSLRGPGSLLLPPPQVRATDTPNTCFHTHCWVCPTQIGPTTSVHNGGAAFLPHHPNLFCRIWVTYASSPHDESP